MLMMSLRGLHAPNPWSRQIESLRVAFDALNGELLPAHGYGAAVDDRPALPIVPDITALWNHFGMSSLSDPVGRAVSAMRDRVILHEEKWTTVRANLTHLHELPFKRQALVLRMDGEVSDDQLENALPDTGFAATCWRRPELRASRPSPALEPDQPAKRWYRRRNLAG